MNVRHTTVIQATGIVASPFLIWLHYIDQRAHNR